MSRLQEKRNTVCQRSKNYEWKKPLKETYVLKQVQTIDFIDDIMLVADSGKNMNHVINSWHSVWKFLTKDKYQEMYIMVIEKKRKSKYKARQHKMLEQLRILFCMKYNYKQE